MSRRLAALLLAACVAGAPNAAAAPPDSAAAEYFAPPASALAAYGDVRGRFDHVEDRPGLSLDLDRTRVTARAGVRWNARPGVSVEAGVRASLGSDRNDESLAAFDNEWSDTLEADRLGVRVEAGPGVLMVGRMRAPFRWTELIWDDDLRPVGAAVVLRADPSEWTSARLVGGSFARSRFDFDDGRVTAVQASALVREGALWGGDVAAGLLAFDHLDALARRGYARQNRVVGVGAARTFASRYRLLDVQVGGHASWRGVPIQARADLVRNLGADTDANAVRLRLAAGRSGGAGDLETGYVYQRIERDAVQAAFNSDDWWFHARSRGHSMWVALGLGPNVSLRLAGFLERRDDVALDTHRWILECRLRLPEAG